MDKTIHLRKNKQPLNVRNNKKVNLLFLKIFFVVFPFIVVGFWGYTNGYFKANKIVAPIPDAVYVTGAAQKLVIQSAPKTATQMLLDDLKNSNIEVASVSGVSDGILVKLSSGGEVIFSTSKDMAIQTSSLQLILSRLTIEGKRFSRLDFRFDKPVITLR